jgi:hypothetical protein
MFAQALANRVARGGVLGGFACLIAAVAMWLTDRTQGPRERLAEARA